MTTTPVATPTSDDMMELLVCGAHLDDLPLNWQLQMRNATLKVLTTTASNYRLYALPGGLRPALVECDESDKNAQAIEVEVWNVPIMHIGSFLAGIPHPLGLGKVKLANGDMVTGFICSQNGLSGATEVTKCKCLCWPGCCLLKNFFYLYFFKVKSQITIFNFNIVTKKRIQISILYQYRRISCKSITCF